MAEVVLGRAGSTVQVDLDVCAKTGVTTRETVTKRGSTTPGWVIILLLFTVIGFLLAQAMTSRSFRVTLPMTHAVHDRWRRTWALAWLVGLAGVGVLVAAAAAGGSSTGPWVVVGLVLLVAASVGGTVNSVVNNVGFRMSRDGDLVLLRAHPDFVRAVEAAAVEPLAR